MTSTIKPSQINGCLICPRKTEEVSCDLSLLGFYLSNQDCLCISVRWKLLLGFSCRNRLLLSGTPIQNSMAELWALLHFIMPTMFDSHDEFNEWFSKDIESHAENKTSIDESKGHSLSLSSNLVII